MMGENPNYWWSLNGKMSPPSDDHIQQPSPTFMSPPAVGGAAAAPPPASLFHPHQYLFGSSLLIPPTTNSDLDDDNHHDDVINQQDFPLSWSQLLMGGIGGDEGQMMMNPWLRTTWSRPINGVGEVIKQELQVDQTKHDQSSIYRDDHHHHHNNFNNININDQDEDDDDENGSQVCSSSWSSHQIPSASSCVTSLTSTNSILDFSTKRKQTNSDLHQCEDISSGGASKRARFQASTTRNPLSTCKTTASKKTRVQHSSSQPPLKIRKEKLGDRITALHQLVSPFGKTDTASVLFEATAHIRFLEGQIEALTSPYLKLRTTTMSASMRHQLSDGEVAEKDLRSRGLCLVPITCIDHIANDTINGSDYWTPALGGSF